MVDDYTALLACVEQLRLEAQGYESRAREAVDKPESWRKRERDHAANLRRMALDGLVALERRKA